MKIRKIIIEILEVTKDGKHQHYYWNCYNCNKDSRAKKSRSYREVLKELKRHAKTCKHRALDTDVQGEENGTMMLPFAVFHIDS